MEPAYTDATIIELIREEKAIGCNLFFKYFYKTHFQKIKAFVLHFDGTPQDAEDTFQDALVLLYSQVLNNYKITNVEGYFITIAKNQWRLKFKKRNRQKCYSLDKINDQLLYELRLQQQLPLEHCMQLFWKLFEQFEGGSKAILLYYFYQQHTLKEVQQHFSLNSQQVTRTKIYRYKMKFLALIKTSQLYQDYYPDFNDFYHPEVV